MALRHLQDPPPPLPRTTPRALAAIVERALAKKPGARYRNGVELANALASAARSAGSGRVARERGGAAPAASGGAARNGHSRTRHVDPTRVAPKLSPRHTVNPSARRRAIALVATVCALVVAMLALARVLSPPVRVRMPQLLRLTRRTALVRARRAHLRPAFTHRFDAARRGLVISQDPGAGASVDEGSSVQVVVSDGPAPVPVPSVLGAAEASARHVLESLGLSVSVVYVPSPGTQPGTVVAQSRPAGRTVAAHSRVVLSAAETPSWREVTTFAGDSSVPFKILGTQWRIVYRMSYQGMCTLIFICDGPNASVTRIRGGSWSTGFGLSEGGQKTRTFESGAGVYQIKVTPGGDSADWSIEVDDYY
jgi:serine/threonine-protein kinase